MLDKGGLISNYGNSGSAHKTEANNLNQPDSVMRNNFYPYLLSGGQLLLSVAFSKKLSKPAIPRTVRDWRWKLKRLEDYPPSPIHIEA